MKRLVAIVALFAGLQSEVLFAACSKPGAPACALERVPFASDKAADDCRIEMLSFRGKMDEYASCLGQASVDEEKAARDEYEDVRVKFNQRARGEIE
jgi:hypothetical protein